MTIRRLFFISILFLLSACASIVGVVNDKPISEDLGKRSWGSFIDDEIIETKAMINLKKANAAFKNAHISIISYNGLALLVGQAPNQALKSLAEETVRKIRKVRRVHNELSIAGPSSALVRSGDNWLTSKIKVRMLFSKGIQSKRIKVVTENGIVYLMGLVSRAEARRVVSSVQNSYGVQKIVKIFEYIGEEPLY